MKAKVLLPFLLLIAGTSFGKNLSKKHKGDDTITVTFKKSELETILKQGDDLPSVLWSLKILAQDADAKKQPEPEYNLCEFKVSAHELFCEDNKGLPRAQMPQLKGQPKPGSKAAKEVKAGKLKADKNGDVDLREQFIAYMRDEKHHKVENPKIVDAMELKAAQDQLVGTRVADVWWNLKLNPEKIMKRDPIFVSEDLYILDGNHHGAAVKALEYGSQSLRSVKLRIQKIDTDIETLVRETNEFCTMWGIEAKAGE